jgi:GDP-mannose 4,6-dehydratase
MSLKNCLITGITGMVGSHMVDYLLEKTNWNIYGLCRWRSSFENLSHILPNINDHNRVFIEYGDLLDRSSLDAIIKRVQPDYIFHLAAQSFPKASFQMPINTFDVNINGTYDLLDAQRLYGKNNSKIHVCSSSEVFGRVSKENLPIDENCSFHPASPYAISKIGTDLIGRHFAEAYNMNIQVTRMFTHTGPRRGDYFAESTFAKQIAMIEANIIDPVIKVGNLKSLRTFADVRDAVKAYYMLLTIDPTPGEFYNIGGTYSCEIGDMLNYLISLSSKKDIIKIEEDINRIRPIDADLQIPNYDKFKNKTGWMPRYSFEQTMNDLLDYWREKITKNKNHLNR